MRGSPASPPCGQLVGPPAHLFIFCSPTLPLWLPSPLPRTSGRCHTPLSQAWACSGFSSIAHGGYLNSTFRQLLPPDAPEPRPQSPSTSSPPRRYSTRWRRTPSQVLLPCGTRTRDPEVDGGCVNPSVHSGTPEDKGFCFVFFFVFFVWFFFFVVVFFFFALHILTPVAYSPP